MLYFLILFFKSNLLVILEKSNKLSGSFESYEVLENFRGYKMFDILFCKNFVLTNFKEILFLFRKL